MTAFPQIVVGTYEEFVLGYKPQKDENEKHKYKLVQSFATHSHQASVRCVATHGELMASAGADEYINIYDMAAMEVSTVINYHDSTVTCLEFTPDGSHLVTANQNGDIAIFRCKNWTLVKLWKEAHKHSNGVTSTSIHPSGSLLLTTGADNIVRFWNLIKGRQAYATNFSKKCSIGNSLNFGMWSKNGKFYAVCIGNKVEIYKMATAAVVYEINTKTKVTCAAFVKKNLFSVGTEEGLVEIHSIITKKLLASEKVHESRVKSMSSFSITSVTKGNSKLEHYLVTVDSKGVIKLWLIRKKGLNCALKLKGNIDCDCRITCLTVVPGKDIKGEKNDVTESSTSTEVEEINPLNQSECSEKINNKKDENISQRKNKNKTKQKQKIKENGISDTNSVRKNLVSTPEAENKKGKKRKTEEIFNSSGSNKLSKKKKLSKSNSKTSSGKWSVEQMDS